MGVTLPVKPGPIQGLSELNALVAIGSIVVLGIAATRISPWHENMRTWVHVFVSMRFGEGGPFAQAQSLLQALKQYRVQLHIVDPGDGQDPNILGRVYSNLRTCDAFLSMGTRHYGERTDNAGCTFYEATTWLSTHVKRNKPRPVLIRMIGFDKDFRKGAADAVFESGDLAVLWPFSKEANPKVPDEVLFYILRRLSIPFHKRDCPRHNGKHTICTCGRTNENRAPARQKGGQVRNRKLGKRGRVEHCMRMLQKRYKVRRGMRSKTH